MYKALLIVLVIVTGLGVFIWSSDRITLEGERTIYTVDCVQGTWDGMRCTGRLAAGDRHRFRSSRSRREVVYWISGSSAPSGKYADCDVTDRDLWSCTAHDGDLPTIAHELVDGRPVQRHAGLDQAISRRQQMEMVGAASGDSGNLHCGLQQQRQPASAPDRTRSSRRSPRRASDVKPGAPL